jgi:clan AA aspartic protease (TIGR02281 family)
MTSIPRKLFISLIAILLLGASPSAQCRETKGKAAAKKAQSHLDALIQNREYPELERLLPQAALDESDRAYFDGVLANRRNELEKSITLLQPVIPELKATQPDRAAVALRSLADDYVKTFRYADADRAYSELLAGFAKRIAAADRQSLEDDAKTNHLLTDAPPQTVEFTGTLSLPTHRSKIGTIESDFTVNGVTESWILDTGANFSVLTETVARAMGLKLSEGTAQTQGASGAENKFHTAIIPEMKIGAAIVRNVVVLVMPDSALRVPLLTGKYQIDAILGFPVLSALGKLTFTSNNELKAEAGGDPSGAMVYMQQLDPLVESRVAGHDLLMFFDTGATGTSFTVRYYNAFRGEFSGLSRGHHGIAGAGGTKSEPSYNLPKLDIGISDQTAVLNDVPVMAEPMGTDFDLLYGTIGRDVTSQFKSFTLDFKAMRFRLTK